MSLIQHFIKVHSVLKYANRFPHIPGFDEAKNLVMQNRIKAEIIGQWLYCFTTPLIGARLMTICFWYSYKHEAWVYSGRPKDGNPDDESLDEIRARLGSSQIVN